MNDRSEAISTNVSALFPLTAFGDDAWVTSLACELIPGNRMPEACRRLLVHDDDLTPTLEARYEQKMGLNVLYKRIEGDSLYRQVTLVRLRDDVPAAFGAIHIDLSAFNEHVRQDILACARPLGAILADRQVLHRSQAGPFFRLLPDALIRDALRMTEACTLFGRRNTLLGGGDRPLAQVVEVLPPVDTDDG